ncbi:acylphosphatase [Candidatus Bathyarchaeota archaeon]|nr:acylphosphatase [Candidatus Bathyarchaeota archaeon]
MSLSALRLTIKGRVQRVGYRRYALDLAQELGLGGYVKNLPDGSVEVLVQGMEDTINLFMEALNNPPPPAVIREIQKIRVEPSPEIKEFRVLYGDPAEELQEGFGAMQSIFLDYWREFKDYREEFKDFRQEFKDYREEFEDFRQEFKDFRQEFKDYREEFRDYRKEFKDFSLRTDESFKLLFEKYGDISEKLTVILETLVKESKETREQLAGAVERLAMAVEALKAALNR